MKLLFGCQLELHINREMSCQVERDDGRFPGREGDGTFPAVESGGHDLRPFKVPGFLVPSRLVLLSPQKGADLFLCATLMNLMNLMKCYCHGFLTGHGMLFPLRRLLPLRQGLSAENLRVSHLRPTSSFIVKTRTNTSLM